MERFTPVAEVELCGHATLAAAHILFETNIVHGSSSIQFKTLHSGELTARRDEESGDIVLDFPLVAVEPLELSVSQLEQLTTGLSINAEDIVYSGKSIYDIVVELTPRAFYNMITINFSSLSMLEVRGIIVTCIGPKHDGTTTLAIEKYPHCSLETDILSRCFFPRYTAAKHQ